MKTTRFHGALLAAAASFALAACGGGGNDAPPPDSNVPPASAGANALGFMAYIDGFARGMFDSSEPVDLSAFTPPAETDAENAAPPVATSIDQ